MRLDRRRFLGTPLAAGAALGLSDLHAGTVLPGDDGGLAAALLPSEMAVLEAFVDTLLPPGKGAPGAKALGIAPQLAESARARSKYLQLLKWGTRWLHHTAMAQTGRGFAALDRAGREKIAAQAEALDVSEPPRAFFVLVHQSSMSRYYADPKTWAALEYAGPPQPQGFLDFDRPPRAGA